MITTRDRLTTALDGGTPDRTPLSIYSWMIDDVTSDAWPRLIDRGLGLCVHCTTVKHVEHGVIDTVEDVYRDGDHFQVFEKETPAGTLRMVLRNGWHHEDWIKQPRDYAIRQWIVEHTELVPQYDEFEKAAALAGDHGVAVVTGSRTPAMSINIDWAGTEQFGLDVASNVNELFDLYEAQKTLFLEETRLIAAGPGRYVKWFENLEISMIGARRYRDLLVPVYGEALPILEASGKRVFVHYDGALRVIADQIAAAPFHGVESLTEPPEGDMLYDECRAAWPDKVFWANINLDLYTRPPEVLREAVKAKQQRAGMRGLAFEISEDLPANWRASIPHVLDALNEP